MQNSAVMAVRATVLLVCLIAVPVAAICGKQAPEFVKALIQDFTGTPQQATANNATASEAPAFRPGLIAVATAPSSTIPSAPAPLPSSGALLQGRIPSSNPKSLPVDEAVADSHVLGSNAGLSGHSDMRSVPGEPRFDPQIARASHQAENAAELRPDADRRSDPNLSAVDRNTTQFAPGYFQAAEARLRALGATYYLLETLGPTAEQYRFVCKVATGSQPDQMLAFFAVDREPLGAMNNVVRQVESWRSQRHGSQVKPQPTGP